MRLLFASDFYPPFLGGVELQTELLAEELAARGHAVTVATVWHDGLPVSEVHGSVPVQRLRSLSVRVRGGVGGTLGRRYHPPFPDPLIVRGLRRIISLGRPDVVHATGWIAYSARLALNGSSIPLVISARDFGYACATRTLVLHGDVCSGPELIKCLRHSLDVYGPAKALVATGGVLALREWLLSGVDAIHAASRYAADLHRRDLGDVSARPVSVIPNMLGPGESVDASGWLEALPVGPFILFVGALQSHKGIGPLLEAYAGLRNPPPLVLVGTRWSNSPATWPSGVRVLFDVPNPVVRQIWDRALFGVAPSLVPETFGNVVLEAMSSGRPMIASRLGGPLDTVDDGRTGFLVPVGDGAAIRDAMQILLDDPVLRERMGAAARARVSEQFSVEAVVPRFEEFYEGVLRRARRTRHDHDLANAGLPPESARDGDRPR